MPSTVKKTKYGLPLHIKPSTASCIFFDIETSGLAMTSEILEIAAACGDKKFDVYITPQQPIDAVASSINQITMVNSVLHYKNMPVDSLPLSIAMQKFIAYLSSVPEPRILLGHNIKKFDCRFIMSALSENDLLPKFSEVVVGFIDTLPLYRQVRPDLPDFKQVTIVKSLLNLNYEEHNALGDVLSLQKVFNFSKIDDNILKKHSFNHTFFNQENMYAQNLRTLLWMKNDPKIGLPLTRFMIEKIVKAGFGYNDLKVAYTKDGKQGLKELLHGPTAAKPRVTQDKKVIESIFQFFIKQKKFYSK